MHWGLWQAERPHGYLPLFAGDRLTNSPIMSKTFQILASLSALLAVAFGAFGAHGLKGQLDEAALAIYRTAVDYHMWHALGLGWIGLSLDRYPDSRLLRSAGWLMFAGILVFSGSLYALSLSGLRWLGMVTPLGGLSFMVAWGLVALALFRLDRNRR
jgi:uncharacterized membrane protein YgdD (TMEM256/DUF423 family)